MDDNETKYKKAKKKVAELRDFYTHLSVYIVVNLGLFFINITTSPEYLWFIWPLTGWGVAIALHALRVYGWMFGAEY